MVDADRTNTATETHRGAYGEFGSDSGGLIDRSFRERIVLVGVSMPPASAEDTEASLEELALLVDTAGADAVASLVQRRQSPDPATYVGRGKVDEIRALAEEVDCDTVVFDDELTPAQQLNLEKQLGRSAIDRTAVILDIFAQNAASPEGKAQVMLAMLRYRLPRLRGRGLVLSQQAGAGGIGARRGPGETQLEIDRRRIVRRIHRLEDQLGQMRRTRLEQRKSRRQSRFGQVAIVGYTNAGKSTLLNRLTSSDVLVEDRLFATLDATTRRLQLPGGERVLVTDTVGFVKKLPHQLVESFKTTLDIVGEADLLLHVVDASGADPEGEMKAVRSVLGEIGAADVQELVVFNKVDAVPDAGRLPAGHEGAVAVSARTGEGMDKLLEAISARLRSLLTVVELHIPFQRADALAVAHREGEVLVEGTDEAGFCVRVRLDEAGESRLAEFVVPPVAGAR
ncbi:MAG: GTPase HflX [Acidimicrobiia bacterium]|nr:GTPase HflX [Acidimicrobiia bacterium]